MVGAARFDDAGGLAVPGDNEVDGTLPPDVTETDVLRLGESLSDPRAVGLISLDGKTEKKGRGLPRPSVTLSMRLILLNPHPPKTRQSHQPTP